MVADGWDRFDEESDEYDADVDQLIELFNDAPTTTTLLDTLFNDKKFHAMLLYAPISPKGLLTAEEVNMVLSEQHVKWDKFHTDIVTEIYTHRATKETTIAARSKQYDLKKAELAKEFAANSYPPQILTGGQNKKDQWNSAVLCMAIPFIEKLEAGIAISGEDDLDSEIRDVLKSNWVPDDDVLPGVIYNIAGALLNNVKKNIPNESNKGVVDAYGLLYDNAVTNRDEARNEGLPIERVEQGEVHELTYVNRRFYEVVVKLQSVFANVLDEEHIKKFGPLIIAKIEASLNKYDVGLLAMMPGADETEAGAVVKRVVESFCNTMGKDTARKHRALAGYNFTETHRATLAIIAKKAKDAANAKKEKKETTENGQLNIEKMKVPELKAELKKRKLRTSGIKKVLMNRLKEHIDKEQKDKDSDGED